MDQKLARIVNEINRQNRAEKEQIKNKIKEYRSFLAELTKAILSIDEKTEKIVLFGSLAEDTVYSLNFDIDIAVESEKYLKILAWCLSQPFPIDCIDYSAAPEHIRERIEQFGEVLYETET